ncbi:hypothetical protein DXV76_03270 [Rhodobacteraceae bacterium CCMM004]|nr:hypothetical protein DXV76_03270 [Rhodobacteraceae bacterium CCMM004]
MGDAGDKVEVLNVNAPHHVTRVDRAKYEAVRTLTLSALPPGPPGITAAALKDAIRPGLPQDLFPEGKTLGWWQKCVQLDLEARGLVARLPTRPLTFHRTA